MQVLKGLAAQELTADLMARCGLALISVTLCPLRASAIEAAQPATPPPTIRTSSCKALLLIHLDVQFNL